MMNNPPELRMLISSWVSAVGEARNRSACCLPFRLRFARRRRPPERDLCCFWSWGGGLQGRPSVTQKRPAPHRVLGRRRPSQGHALRAVSLSGVFSLPSLKLGIRGDNANELGNQKLIKLLEPLKVKILWEQNLAFWVNIILVSLLG